MSRSLHAAAESCTAAIRRATRFRALPDFQFFSMSLPVCSYFASSSLISFFISTTNKGTGSGQCFPSAALRASCPPRDGFAVANLWGDRASRLVYRFFRQARRSESRPLATKRFFQKNPDLGFHFCFCVSYPFYPRLPRRSPWRAVILMEVARRRRLIRGRLQKLRGSLAGGACADKIGFLWLNTELRGCRATELATM
jgi:hypothetical protein